MVPYQKGGEAVKWFGNNQWVVDWQDDGAGVKGNVDPNTKRIRSHNYNGVYSFREGITWSSFSNGGLAFRYVPPGSLFDSTGSMAFSSSNLFGYLALLNTPSVFRFLKAYSPSPRIKIESLLAIPDILQNHDINELDELSRECVQISSKISRFEEVSPTFAINKEQDLLSPKALSSTFKAWRSRITENEIRMEELLSKGFGFSEHGTIDNGTGGSEFNARHLISYAIGCMMGRYSLDEPGLIYAHAATSASTRPATRPSRPTRRHRADHRRILVRGRRRQPRARVPSRRVGRRHARRKHGLARREPGHQAGETADETIRRYLADKFFKDHLQTYKKRPIYWLFSSGKQGAFQALVYLHRYHEGTLARLRAEYVVPLTGKMQTRIDMLEKDAAAAPSTAARNKLNKQIEKLRKKHVELLAYDEKLRHCADMRISLDLDDGVKVNYGKFGDLLAEVKAVTGGTGEE